MPSKITRGISRILASNDVIEHIEVMARVKEQSVPNCHHVSSFFHTSYKQCKDDTNHVASWLATTAKRCGYPSDLLTSAAAKNDAQTAPKLKGRARKLARDAPSKQSALQSKDEAPPKKVYIIARKDFVTLADFIASYSKPPVQVPATLLTLLNRVIALRKRHARWYSYDLSDENLNRTPPTTISSEC